MNDETAGGAQDWRERRRQLQDAVERHMIRYIGDFPPFFIERAAACTSSTTAAAASSTSPPARCARRSATIIRTWLPPYSAQLRARFICSAGSWRPRWSSCAASSRLLPPQLQKVILLNTGSEANEAAIRMAKLASGGHEVVGLTASFHGLTGGAGAATYSVGRRGYGPALPGSMAIPAPNAYRCPIRHCSDACDLSCLEVGFELIDAQRAGQPAAAIAEPILSTGGVIVPPPGYFPRLKELCARAACC